MVFSVFLVFWPCFTSEISEITEDPVLDSRRRLMSLFGGEVLLPATLKPSNHILTISNLQVGDFIILYFATQKQGLKTWSVRSSRKTIHWASLGRWTQPKYRYTEPTIDRYCTREATWHMHIQRTRSSIQWRRARVQLVQMVSRLRGSKN